MPLRKDIWRLGAVRAPLASVLREGLAGREIVRLQETAPLSFLADPFGLWRGGLLYVFAEAHDYRNRHGAIEALTFDAALRLVDRRGVLKEPWHLSYPYVLEANGEILMLPEAFRSGRLTAYRAAEFPHRWEKAFTITLDQVPIDATPVFHDGLWWLFYAPATTREAKLGALHVAFAERIEGPWTAHPRNPVRLDASSSRPGGTPAVVDGALVIPVQDCRKTYGGGIRPLTVTRLTTTEFEASAGAVIAAAGEDGLHTLSAAGELTLLDTKRFHLSATSLALDVRHLLGKALG